MLSTRILLKQNQGRLRLLEAHDDNTTQIVRRAVGDHGEVFQGIWMSSLTQTTYFGIPDTELISPLTRATLVSGSCNNPEKDGCRPLCAAYDADNGGNIADIPSLIAVLSKMGISMIVIEDKSVIKPGQKVNSLDTASNPQNQMDRSRFKEVLRAFKSACAISQLDMMITARIESLTVRTPEPNDLDEQISAQQALDDALSRAEAYRDAQADAIMIHSRSTSSSEVLKFLTKYRSKDSVTPLVVVPTTYSKTVESVLYRAGANIIIYANHLMRGKIHALGEFSDRFFHGETPERFFQDASLNACLRVRNFGCLLRKISAKKELSKDPKDYGYTAERLANENMIAVAKSLLDGKVSGAADSHIVTVKQLLEINAHQVSDIE